MKLLDSLAFTLLLIFFILEPSQSLFQNSSMITDLEILDSSGFTNEANNWVYKGVSCSSCVFSMLSGSSCGSLPTDQFIYGGPNAVVTGATDINYLRARYTTTGSTWTQIGYEFDLWLFTVSPFANAASITDPDSIFYIKMSSYVTPSKCLLTSSCSTDFMSNQGSHIKYIYKYHVQGLASIPDENPMPFAIRVVTSSVDSLGLRDLKIYNLASSTSTQGYPNFPCNALSRWNGVTCVVCHVSCLTCFGSSDGQCTTCQSNFYDYGNGTCRATCDGIFQPIIGTKECAKRCSTGFYWARNQSCVETCEGPLVKSTDENGFAVCSSPCLLDSQFVYPDKTCSITCHPPLKQRNEATIKFCLNPCLKTGMVSPLFLYPDGFCDNTCLTHLTGVTIQNVKYCKSSCLATEFIYPNGNCKSACDSPLTSQDHHSILFCTSPCNPSDLTMYLYPDSSCDTCPFPLEKKVEDHIQYCYHPCSQDKAFLKQNGICEETCIFPSLTKIKPIGKFCELPCANENDYFNTQSGKCTKTCEYPAEAVESPLPKLCKSSLSEEEVKQVKAIAETANNANSASSTGTMIWSVISSSDSTSACLGPLAKMLQYIKFMDVRFPEKVLILMAEHNKGALKGGFAKNMMGEALEKFPRHELPSKFELYQTPSSFFVNLWPALFNLSVILLVTVLMIILTEITKENAKVNSVLKSLTEILKWNVFLVTFCGSIGDIILYTALEFQSMQFDNTGAVFSFILCLAMNTLVIFVVIKILDVNSAIRQSKKTIVNEEDEKLIEQKWSSYKALFECYKDYSFFQQIFLFLFVMRLAFFNAIIGYLYNYPLFQAAIGVVMNILMLGYLIFKRPMKKLVNLIQQIILELVLLPFNVSVLALAIMDDYGIAEFDRRKSIGNVIVYINVIVPILSLVLMAAKAIVMGVDLYRSWKFSKENKTKKLVQDQRSFHQNDILSKTEEKLSIQSASSPNKSLADQTQILDLTDQSTLSLEHYSVRSNQRGNSRIKSLRPTFMGNNYYHKNSIPMTTSQNLIMPDYQNGFQREQESRSPMRIKQDERRDQYFQNETQSMMSPQINRKRIRQRKDHTHIQNHIMNRKLGFIE